MTRKEANNELEKLGWTPVRPFATYLRCISSREAPVARNYGMLELISHRARGERGLGPALERLVKAVRKLEAEK